jgi:hypothetical protein
MGIFGLVAWFLFIYLFMSKLRVLSRAVRYDRRLRWMRLFANAFMVVILTLLISGMFGHNLYRYTWYVLAGLTVALYNMLPGIGDDDTATASVAKAATVDAA